MIWFRQRSSHRKPMAAHLQLEQLEGRWCPASYSITDLGTLGGNYSHADAINVVGQVVGGASLGTTGHAFLWTPGGTNGVATNPPMLDLGTLGGTGSQAHAINAAAQVVGESYTASGDNHAFLWADLNANGQADVGEMQDLGTLGGSSSVALGINNATPGHAVQVVGYSSTGAATHAFLWTEGGTDGVSTNPQMKDLGTLGGAWSQAAGINDAGQVCGTANLSGDSLYHAFVWKNGMMTDIGALGSSTSSGRAINASGQVVGQSYTAKGTEYHAFRWAPSTPNGTTGKMTDLGTLNGWYTYNDSDAHGINDAGAVVGHAEPPNSAFQWPSKGAIKDLNAQIPTNSGWVVLESAAGINKGGQIVGQGQLPGGIRHGFMLTPTSGKALTAAGTATAPVAATLSQDQVAPLLAEALARWQTAGVETSSLKNIQVHIGDLSGNTLGQVAGNTIWIDANAAGWGWFVDATPGDDGEFTMPGDQGEQNRMDLLSALAHEVGHLLGYDHADAGVMAETLAAGARAVPWLSDVGALVEWFTAQKK